MTPRIDLEVTQNLPPGAQALLKTLFAGYRQIIVKREFTGNLSGSRVFLVQPVAEDGATLPVVVKFAAISLIEREWQAYQNVRQMLYGMVQIQAHGLSTEEDWGALCYPLQGGGVFSFESLHDYYRQHTPDSVVSVLCRLFKTLASIHNQSQARPGFSWRASYDHILPLNLLLEASSPPLHTSFQVINAANLHTETLQPGDWVRLEGFAVTKVDLRRQTITLNLPRLADSPVAFCVRVKTTGQPPAYRENQIIPFLEGQVLTTRQSQLQSYAHALLGEKADSLAERVISHVGLRLPNPFVKIPSILNQYRHVRTALIHGDLNVQNVLVDAETGFVSLIDIAEAREDHVLHDFFRLETEVVTHLLPSELYQHHLPPCQTMLEFYQDLHCTTFGEVYGPPHTLSAHLHKPFAAIRAIRQAARRHLYSQESDEYYQGLLLYLVGALKFANLDEHPTAPLPKQAAFWGAAAIAQLLEAAPACAGLPAPEPATQPPQALLIAYKPDVKVLRRGVECFSPPAYGMPLYNGDVVSTFVNAGATVHCAEGSLIIIPAERNQLVDCRHVPQERVKARLDLHYTAPLPYLVNDFSANMVFPTGDYSTLGLMPRNTRIAESRPTFRWQPQNDATGYRLSVRTPTGEHWHVETMDTVLPYPDTAPSLSPGSGNTVILEALDALTPPEQAYLEMLDSDGLDQVQRAETGIRALSLDPVAATYLFAQLYRNWGLWSAAIAQLEPLSNTVEPVSPAVWLQLGELYLRVGDYGQAQERYEIARQSAENGADDAAWSVACIGLACAHYAQNHPALARKSLVDLDGGEYATVAHHIRAQFEISPPVLPQYKGAVNLFAYARFLAQHIATHLSDEIRQISDHFLEQLQALSNYPLKPAAVWNTLGPDKFAPMETLAATYLTTRALVKTLSAAEIEALNNDEQLKPYLENQARRIAQETLGLSAPQAQDFAGRYAALVAADPDVLLRLFTHKDP